DANGNLIAGSRTRYEPYGATAAGAVPTIGFTGHVHDANTGLVYMQQRYYDPFAGRFLSTDPVLTDANTGASFNRYVYANNNPLRFIDPDGRQVADVGGSPETPHARCNGGNLCFGGNSVGEQIAENATASALAGNNAATYGWAFAGAYWEYFGSEGVSQVASKGSGAGSGNYAMAALEIGTLGKGKLLGQFGSKTTSLFRAVSPGEFNSIMASGKLSFAAGAAEMKQFGYKLDEVLKFANTSSEYAAIIRIQVDSKVLKHLHLSNTIDPWIFKSGVVTAVGDDALRVLNNAIISVKQAF
ncbi:MAG: hypothetical protein RL748_2719, partial [Pseudomonadota bacterium]